METLPGLCLVPPSTLSDRAHGCPAVIADNADAPAISSTTIICTDVDCIFMHLPVTIGDVSPNRYVSVWYGLQRQSVGI